MAGTDRDEPDHMGSMTNGGKILVVIRLQIQIIFGTKGMKFHF